MVPPKISISELMERLKGRTEIRILQRFSELRKRCYRGNHFWAPGFCVDTVDLDAEMIGRYVQYQETREKEIEQQQLKFWLFWTSKQWLRLSYLGVAGGTPLWGCLPKPRPLGGVFYSCLALSVASPAFTHSSTLSFLTFQRRPMYKRCHF